MMTTTRAIANDIGAAPISDNWHGGVSPVRSYQEVPTPRKLLFYPTPYRELAMRLENDFTPLRAEFSFDVASTGRSHRHASACLAATRRLSGGHGLGIKSTPSGSWPSRGCPDVRITGRKGQRILTSRAKSIPSIAPGSRISAKIMATSQPT